MSSTGDVEKTDTAKGRRVVWIDWARALGACSIVLLHVLVSTGRALGDTGLVTARSVTYAVTGMLACRWAVPAFMMVSGILLLDESHQFGWDKACRHSKRMLLAIATFGTAFALMEQVWGRLSTGHPLDATSLVVDTLAAVLTTRTWDHLWYVYAMALAYLAIPPLRAAKETLGAKKFSLMTWGLFLAVIVVPFALALASAWGGTYVSPYETYWLPGLIWNAATAVTCMCLGDWMRDRMRVPLTAAGLAGGIAMVVAWWLAETWELGFAVDALTLHRSPLAILYGTGVLCAIRNVAGWCRGKTGHGNGVVSLLAQDSFGIYVLHPLFIHVAVICLPASWLSLFPMWEAGLTVGAIASSVLLTRTLRRVPVIGTTL